MIVIGIVGGVASGKSVVAELFARCGATVIDGDQYGHQVLKEKGVISAIRKRWGRAVLDSKGNVDRKEVGRRVFASPETGQKELEFLEGLSHPLIKTMIEKRIHEVSREATSRMVVLDAAVMLKAGWDKLCDTIVYVDAPRELRRDRAVARGWDTNKFDSREQSQRDLVEKRRVADYVVDNWGTREETEQQVRRIVDLLFVKSN